MFTAFGGCDSIMHLSLSLYQPQTVNLGNDYAFCNTTTLNAGSGITYIWSNSATSQTISVTQAGTYAVTVTDANGCTSTDGITVQELPASQTNLVPTICEGDFFQVGNSIYTQSGSYVDTLVSIANCDSIVFTNLTVNAPVSLSIDSTLCYGGSITINGTTYNATNPTGSETLLAGVLSL
ncbi:MAG: hypothetical protein IPN76_26060 [Saprospiraceae bacterium]|nr:hypothetical protein [Saprospiraceae bacterium]